jgi:hypothetical protein
VSDNGCFLEGAIAELYARVVIGDVPSIGESEDNQIKEFHSLKIIAIGTNILYLLQSL